MYCKGLKEGQGEYYWPHGDSYIGDHVNGQPHGKGTFTYGNNGGSYIGDFVNGKKEGQGFRIWPNGSRYEGPFLNGEQHGKGMFTDSMGMETESDWVSGKRLTMFS